MVVILLLLSLLTASVQAATGQIEQAFKTKKYRTVSDVYRSNMKRDYSKKELIMISFSLRKLGFFRQDIKLNSRLVKKHYLPEHTKLIKAIKRGDTIDGDDYPNALKVLYWNLFTSYGQILKGYNHDSSLVEKDNKMFVLFSKLLSDLEFREGKVDKYNDQIIAHRQYLANKIYRFKASWSFQYVSWQQDAILKRNGGGEGKLIITNKGYCVGGDAGYENQQFHFYVDGCILYGSGSVKNNDQAIVGNYRQENVPALGLKIGPGASLIVSSTKSRIGIKIPMIYSSQKLTTPEGATFTVDQRSSLSFITSLYSRWQFDKWYVQTEFGKYIQQEQTFWGLGIGREF